MTVIICFMFFIHSQNVSPILTKPQWKLIEQKLQQPQVSPELRKVIESTIFHHHIPLAKKMCNEFTTFHKYKSKSVHKDDLQFHSISGLYHAVRKYNGHYNFVKFAKIYINGALYNGLTKHYPISKVPKRERAIHKGRTEYVDFDSIRQSNTNLYLGTFPGFTLKSNINSLPLGFPIEDYIRKWEKINNLPSFQRELMHKKFDFEFNVKESNKILSIYYGCSEETIRKNVKKTIMNLTFSNI